MDEPFIGLDVSNLSAVCAFPGRASCRLIGRTRRIRGCCIGVGHGIFPLFALALFLAHLTSILVFEQTR